MRTSPRKYIPKDIMLTNLGITAPPHDDARKKSPLSSVMSQSRQKSTVNKARMTHTLGWKDREYIHAQPHQPSNIHPDTLFTGDTSVGPNSITTTSTCRS